jgi:hypothetical protein
MRIQVGLNYLKMKITKIQLEKDNRMLRVGIGKHNGLWFFRVDLWFVGYRLTK